MVSVPPAAEQAWQAYQAMLESKEAHFALLEAVNNKQELGQQAMLAERAHLANLLARHNECVALFGSEMKRLAGEDKAAHRALLALISELNKDLA